MIIIDGRQSDMHLGNFSNLEEILVAASTECQNDQRMVTDVFLNNEAFTELYPHHSEDIENPEIRKVEVRSVPLVDMAVDITNELFKVAQIMHSGSAHVASLFRRADDAEALEVFQDLLDVTRDFMSMVGVLRSDFVEINDVAFASLVERVSELLGEMSEVLGDEDWIMLADLLEFEFAPLCEEWHVSLAAMRQHICDAGKSRDTQA